MSIFGITYPKFIKDAVEVELFFAKLNPSWLIPDEMEKKSVVTGVRKWVNIPGSAFCDYAEFEIIEHLWKYNATDAWNRGLGLSAELMPNQVDRIFNGASAWTNVDINEYNETGDLSITANAANQYCTLPVNSAPTTIGKIYRLTFDVGLYSLAGTWTIQSYDSTQTIGIISTTGAQSFIFTAATTGGLRLVSNENNSDADIDNFSLKECTTPNIQFEKILTYNHDNVTFYPHSDGYAIQDSASAVVPCHISEVVPFYFGSDGSDFRYDAVRIIFKSSKYIDITKNLI